ncbi:multidrug effflux MFS transporter [Variovorax atrisoli]|uniref:multidrug effflux MFS transporter n=1 Tax=Variovorax atrisoli TaxID=3394203 RepID=UPI00161BDE49|nr:multidrug effflux MFS transporter [Variovorax sp. BK613]MBB3641804.1 DHA1 family bicyclomycin/chloramphenicol resistance-like MFS transporter [Variovorax sp. BK613]
MLTPTAIARPTPREFIVLAAAVMSVNAVAVDALLPALAAIGTAVNAGEDNRRQWLITAYLIGFGISQLVYGTLSDHYGRKPLMLAGLAIYACFAAASAFAGRFETAIVLRVLQGCGGGISVLAVSIIRDRHSGDSMVRVMSLAFLLFLGVPIFVPSLGHAILVLSSWQWVFAAIALFGALLLAWVALRLPETLPPERRMPLSPRAVSRAFADVLSRRESLGYTLASTALVGALFGIVTSGQQLFANVFRAPEVFPLVFGTVASCVALAALLNGRAVGRFGARRTSHAALMGYLLVASVHAGVACSGLERPWVFTVLQSALMFCFGLMLANFGSLAMARLAHVAGTASAVQSLVINVGGALIGILIGQRFDGTAVPMTLGSMACGLMALAMVLVAEHGRLFRPVAVPMQVAG